MLRICIKLKIQITVSIFKNILLSKSIIEVQVVIWVRLKTETGEFLIVNYVSTSIGWCNKLIQLYHNLMIIILLIYTVSLKITSALNSLNEIQIC